MSEKKSFCDYTEQEFLDLVRKICMADGETEEDDINNLLEFEKVSEHPDGSDLIYYPQDGQVNSPEGIVKEVKQWRKANGKPGFKES
ncbi:TPA: bacteriocin immunity protein [Enterobacter bugandensis]|uniref:bacteriocin immunity protein n=1 Tax=Enterobacter bugandensis TaxID=881260 RepID=UPI00200437D5|nr:bacteriocin immunity protein [Enterobacter bugandensis]MCK7409188.1 bacteriocin immunity protein [Enterobacter bugandensis]